MKLNFRRFVAILLVAMMTLTALPTAGIAEVMQDVSRESGSIRTLMVEPDDETYYTYEFYDEDGTTPIASQIVKSGDTLLEPAAPAKANKKFTRWNPQVPFGPVGELTGENKTIKVTAEYTEVYYVFFVDHNGRVVKTKEAADGEPVTTADVLFPVEADHAITGWYTDAEFTTPVTTVTINKANVTLYAKVEAGHWLTFESDGGSYVAPVFVPNGKTAAKPANPTRPGYTFAGWDFDFNTVLTADATATAKWTVDTRTQYTVIHWQENADDDEYSYVESETKYGTTDATTAATAKRYNGFTAQTITQQTIAGDGSTIVNVYYTRNVYSVTFWTVNRRGQKGTEYVGKRITAKHGANIRDKWPGGTWKVSAGGSVFQANIDVMPIGGFEFFETDQGSGKAYYYLADLNGNYVLDHTDTGAGWDSTVTKEDRYDITGFVCNTRLSTKNGHSYNGAKFYYDRDEFDVVYINNGATVKTKSYKYQQDISDAGNYKLSDKDAPQGKEGYIFDGWAADADGTKPYDFTGKTMPAQKITVYAMWKAPIYTVTFIDHNGEQYGDVATVKKGKTVTEPEYTVSLSKDEQFLGWVLADGTPFNFATEINQDYVLYAKVASTAAYSVTYDANGGSGDVPVDSQKYAEGALADVKPADGLTPPQGKEIFLGWSTNPEATTAEVYPYGKLAIGTADVTLYAIWGVRENTVAITYKGNGGALTDGQREYTISSLPNNGKIEVAQNTFVKAGYNFVSWNTQADGKGTSFAPGAEARVNGEGENVLYAIWEARTDTKYIVEFYYQNTDGTYPTEANESVERQGTTDAWVEVKPEDKNPRENNKYVWDETADNIEGGTVSAVEPLVLKLYFKLNTAPYTIHHYLLGTTIQVAKDQTGTMQIGEELTAAPAATRMEGTNVYEYAPRRKITISADPTKNVITVYYAKNVTFTGESGTRVYNGTEQKLIGIEVEGLLDGDTWTGLNYSAKGTDVGGYDGEFTGAMTLANAAGTPVSYYNVILREGKLTITPNTDEVTVTITGNHDSKVYNGSEQSVTGYTTDVGNKTITVALKDGSKAEAKGTNVGKYYMGLTEADFTVTSENYSNIKVVVNDGWLEITPITDEVVVTITGNTDTQVYNATEQSVTGYTTDVGTKTITVTLKETGKDTAKGTNVGKYYMGLTAEDFTVTSENYSNIKVVVEDGWLEITPITDEVTVTITGNTDTQVYNATEQSVTGYTTDVGSKTITVALKDGSKAEAKGTNVGKYYMGLTANDFTVTSKNYSNIKVVVNDGWLEITPITDEVVVTITGNTDTQVYNATEQSVTGYTTDVGTKTITVTLKETGKDTAKGTNVGKYYMGLTAEAFTVTSQNYENITVVVNDGWLEITPITDEVVVTITGNTDTQVYNGSEQSVTGYTTDVGTKTIEVALKDGKVAEAKGTNVGKYYMGLTAEDFTVTSENYSNIKVIVNDGWLEITPITDEVTVTITGNTATRVYNATEQSVTGYTTDVGSKTIDVTLKETGKDTAKGTNVGKYYMGLTAEDFTVTSENYSNIKVIVNDGWLEITPITDEVVVTITGNTDTQVYNATEQSVTGYTTDVGEKTIAVALKDGSKAEAKGTNVGKYYMGLTAEDFTVTSQNYENITVVVNDGWLEITPITDEVVVTITGNTDTQVYNATEQSVTGYTTDVGSKTITVTLNETDKDTAKGTNVGKYYMGLTADDFTVTSENYSNIKVIVNDGWLEITPITDEVVVTITGNTDTQVYNATEQSVTGYTTDVGTKTITVTLNETGKDTAKGTNVGKYYMGLTADDFTVTSENYSNIKVIVNDGWLEITPITDEVIVTITGNTDTQVYNATEQSVAGYTTDVGSKTIDVALKEAGKDTARGTDVDHYPMGLTVDDFTVTSNNYANIRVIVVDGYLDITPITDKVTVTIEGHKDTFKYDGTEHTVTGYDVTGISNALYTENDFTFSGTAEVKEKNASESAYPMGLDASQFTNVSKNFSNVEFVVTDGEMTINPRNIIIRANDNTVEYDGKPHGENGYTLEGDGLAEGEKILGLVIDGERTEAGFYPGELKPHDALIGVEGEEIYPDNYKIEYANGNLEITPVAEEVVVTITEHGGKAKYDGAEHVVTGYDVTSISNPLYTEKDFAFNGKAEVKGIDAGSYPMLLKSEDFVNISGNFAKVTFVIVDATLEIEKREVTLTSASDEKVYDGKALTNDEVTVSGDGFAEGEGAYCGVTGRQLNVGESDNEFTYELLQGTKAGNYKITKEYGKLKVTPVTEEIVVTITGHKNSAKYDGTEKTVTGYDVSISNDLYQETDFTFSGDATASGLHAGKYPMGLKAEDFKNTSENFANVKFVVEDGEMEIQKIALTITSESYEGDYDAQWHEVGYTAEGLAATDAITALEMKNHRILKPGEMVSEFVADTLKITHADGSDATGDYEVTFVPGKLTVNTVIVNYRVFYYYDGVLDESEIEEGTGEVLTQITEYKDKPKDMQFDHVTGFPLTLGLDEMKNIIRVYYVHTPLTGNLGAVNIGDCIE